jgi:xanthine dehydrogenase YagS FAD-binding subunit
VAAVVVAADGVWRDGRVVLGGVAPVPYRARVVEEALASRDVRGVAADAATRLGAVARPMRDNADKVPLVQALVEDALREAVA